MGLLLLSIDLKDTIDKSKIERKKARIKVTSLHKHDQKYENLICNGVDSKVDKDTLQYKEVTKENGKRNLRNTREQSTTEILPMNWTLKIDISPTVITNIGATDVLAEGISAVLEESDNVNTVKTVFMDNTSINTGCEAGLVNL